jgi:hypothetical protein
MRDLAVLVGHRVDVDDCQEVGGIDAGAGMQRGNVDELLGGRGHCFGG